MPECVTYKRLSIRIISPQVTESLYFIRRERRSRSRDASRSGQICRATLISARTEFLLVFINIAFRVLLTVKHMLSDKQRQVFILISDGRRANVCHPDMV